jgi:hypothetical protein
MCVPTPPKPKGQQAQQVCNVCCMVDGRCGCGGKFLTMNGAVSQLRLDLDAQTATSDANTFSACSGITGGLNAFNYLTRTLIQSTSFSFYQGTLLGGGNVSVHAEGQALVNNVPTAISFDAAFMDGVITFDIMNSDTAMILAGGTGEAGRSALLLSISILS